MILSFPKQPSPDDRESTPGGPAAQVHAMPPARHKQVVNSIVTEMLKQPTPADAEEILVSHLYIEACRLADMGIPDLEIEFACHAFARAVWTIVLPHQTVEDVA